MRMIQLRASGGARASGAFLLAVACQSPSSPRDRLPEPTRVGEHLRFYTDEDGDATMCAGTLEYMDRYLHQLIQVHGASPDLIADYYWFSSDPDRIDEICSYGTACTFADAVTVTSIIPHEHELVHAVRGESGFSQNFLEEGAAEIWGAHSDRDFDYSLPIEPAITLAEETLPIPYYGVAGRFSSFVLFEYGLEAFLEVGRLAPAESKLAEVNGAFESVTGVPLSRLVQDYEDANWRCARSVYRDDSIACAVAQRLDCSTADDDGTLSIQFDLDCSSDHFVGPRDGAFWSDVVVPLAQNRNVYLGFTADDDGLDPVSVHRCDVGCEGQVSTVPLTRPLDESEVVLYEGQYLFRIQVPADGQPRGKATLTVRNACDPRV